jgi:hypothetical protein
MGIFAPALTAELNSVQLLVPRGMCWACTGVPAVAATVAIRKTHRSNGILGTRLIAATSLGL